MKTTSYDISKKLAEIGFSPIPLQHTHSWVDNGFEVELYANGAPCPNIVQTYPAYNFDTIWDALPEKIKIDNSPHSPEWLSLYKTDIGYGSMALPEEMRIRVDIKDDESLADTAARMLLLLESKGLVKFNN